MNKHLSQLLQACSLITLSSAPLWANAQTPTSTPAPPPAAPMSSPAPAPAAPPPTSEEGSYLIGVNFGQSLHQFGITNEVSIDTIVRGLKDGMGGKKLEQTDQHNLQAFIHSLMDGIAQRNEK